MRPRVKICCISSIDEAKMALHHGADHLGLVGPMPSGPGILDLEAIRVITNALPANVDTWLLTSKTDATSIVREFQLAGTRSLQLVDEVATSELIKLKTSLPAVPLIQVIHVTDRKAIDNAVAASAFVDRILLDSGNPNAIVKELGGTGRTHNWEISEEVVKACPIPVYLAGGLKPINIAAAIDAVQPAGVDLCSGIRSSQKLDTEKLQEFFRLIAH